MRQLHRWDDALSVKDTNVFAKEVSSILIHRIRCDETRGKLRDFIDRDDFLALSDYYVDYARLSVSDAMNLRQVQALFQKRRDLGCDIAREINALRSFREAERMCKESNFIFRRWSRGGFQFRPRVDSWLFAAQRKIARVLGDVPLLSDLHVRFGPGSTTNVPKRIASARSKLNAPLACSGDLSGTVAECLEELPGWLDFADQDTTKVAVEVHPGNLAFIPKDRKTFRAIGPEPVLNGMFQLGIGSYMAKRLRGFGVDIRDQTRNQKAARSGSIDGGLATLDLSSASDTISVGVVEHLLPHDWYLFLSRFRTGTMEYCSEVITLEKFSTMGNGFTFPLETLIFWALAQSVCVGKEECDAVSVYGDDIIVPSHRYADLTELLTACGFSVNMKKSFSDGPFRESCGADYLSGINIRPYYLRDSLSGDKAFGFYNFFQRLLDTEICDLVRSYLDPLMILEGPDGFGDGHLVNPDAPLVAHQRSRGYGGYTFETYSWTANRHYSGAKPGDRVLPCYSIYTRETPSMDPDAEGREAIIDPRLMEWLDFPYWRCPTVLPGTTISYRKGKLGTPVPGRQSYKRMKIYVFA